MSLYKLEKSKYGLFISRGDGLVAKIFDEISDNQELGQRIVDLLNQAEESTLNQIRVLLKKEQKDEQNMENS